jgi:predicted Fe-Mo cluster-binding NifX family protein
VKTAFATWGGRISPVFDAARRVRVVETDSGEILCESLESLADEPSVYKARRLAELGVETLVCGAVSRTLHEMLAAYGIRVVAWVSGDLEEVVRDWVHGRLRSGDRSCRRRRGGGLEQTEGRRSAGGEAIEMVQQRKTGGKRTGSGPGRGGRQAGGMRGGGAAPGSGGNCVCPQCGARQPHERGVPCFGKSCPSCGAPMIREQ